MCLVIEHLRVASFVLYIEQRILQHDLLAIVCPPGESLALFACDPYSPCNGLYDARRTLAPTASSPPHSQVLAKPGCVISV